MQSNTLFAVIFIFFTVLTIIASLQDSIFIGHRKSNLSFIKNTVQSILKIPLLFFFITFSSFGIVVSYAIGYFVSVTIALLILLPMVISGYLPIPLIDLKIMAEIFHYSTENYIAYVFENMPSFVLPILITNILSPETTAYFYVSWMFASIVFFLPKAIATSLFAEGSNSEHSLNKNVIMSLTASFFCVSIAIVLVIFLGDKMLLLFGKNYSENATKILYLLVLSTIPMILNETFVSIKRVEKKIIPIIAIYLIISSSTIITAYSLSEQLGLLSIGFGWLASQLILAIYTGIYIMQFLKKERTR